ncbi:hypothetical protein PSN45_002977 [Yamadazyma tenuis]|uniref:GATA-type domain-containing protein n=1 Tax=Candida tenuis (strain ATCC 10573 / BCRC 21748 / CBS 615 / JCM 9827 / NBRC 10315 / NRRL Y-1498 / VKM Y-70) TaxID=590646 RepID=G3AW12_CANTC|nr:uncharacterized protein CANTEDRAFT_91588 [Yamadazyma tenuis ATCC 10573]EGV66424.1 hypothetical protein CANTEDRAFT_91588 [Yamadazyma tenuis ATCC 10573]WEJ95457.1 hypothetical protein PSN45_002977 [Yamadazyma tenuis]
MSGVNLQGSEALPSFSKIMENAMSNKFNPQIPATHQSCIKAPFLPDSQSRVSFSNSYVPDSQPPTNMVMNTYSLKPACHSSWSRGSNDFTYYASSPYHHTPNSSVGSYPVNYQFPPPPLIHHRPYETGADVDEVKADDVMRDITKLMSTSQDVSENMELLKREYHALLYSKLVNSPANDNASLALGSEIRPTNRITLDSIKHMLLSVPPSVLVTLEFYSQEHHRILANLKASQAKLLTQREREQLHAANSVVKSDTGRASAGSNANATQPVITYQKRKSMSSFKNSSGLSEFKPGLRRNSKSEEHVHQESKAVHHSKSKSVQKMHTSHRSVFKFPELESQSPLICTHCGSEKTPEWRRGPDGDKTLCNACGIFYSKLIRKYNSPKEAASIMKQRKSEGLEIDRHV